MHLSRYFFIFIIKKRLITYYGKMSEAKKRSSRISCCVVGCNNRYCNTESDIQFYSLPARLYEIELRNKWILAVSRKNPDGSLWKPSSKSRICSRHFVGGKKSGDPLSTAHVPSLFLKSKVEGEKLKKLKIGVAKSLQGYERQKNRREIRQAVIDQDASNSHDIDTFEVNLPENERRVENKSIQVMIICNYDLRDCIFEFSCNLHRDNDTVGSANTQANISLTNLYKVKQKDQLCGPDNEYLEKGFCGYNSINKSLNNLNKLTGIRKEVFKLFLTMLPELYKSTISKEDRLLIFLMKMKTGMTFDALSVIFNVHPTTISRIFKDITLRLAACTRNYIFWPSREVIINTMPKAFKIHYSNCRVIIDCTEIKTEQPRNIDQRIFMYSAYKSGYTVKFLIGIAPSGAIIFVSKCYGGKASDSFITNDSGFLKLIEPGDLVLADKGFPGIKTILQDQNAIMVLPPFLHEGHLTEEEVEETYNIASVRIQVERCIQRVKIYDILNKLTTELLPLADDIIHLCCVMANLQPPIIKDDN